jgi:hypothetical protein
MVANGTSLRSFLPIVPLFSYAPGPCPTARVNVTMRFYINIIPIDEGKTCSQVTTDVRASARLVDLQYHISEALQAERFIGPDLHSSLDILPMQDMPTLDDLKKQDLTILHTKAYQPNNLPVTAVHNFFSTQDLDKIHFLVWLPLASGEFIGPIYPILS